METVELRVLPIPGGWMLQGSAPLAALAFRSGGAAERRAERLAKAIAASGCDTKIVVLDQAGQVAGTKWFWAEDRPEAPADESGQSTLET